MPKAQFSTQLITKDLWKEFIKKFPEYKEMKWDEFYEGWKDIAQTIREEAVYNPLGVKMGSYTGEIKLQYLPYKFKADDPFLSEQMGEKVQNVNLVTGGKVAKIKWERRWAVRFNKMLQFFGFEPTREINHMAAEHTKENPEKIRISRNTLGGKSIFNQKLNK